MGVYSSGGKQIRREDLADSAIESIRRNQAGDIQHQNVATQSGTTITGTAFSTTTQTGRAFASSIQLTVATTGTAGGGGFTISRNGASLTSTGAVTSGTPLLSTSGTFTETGVTWTLNASVTTGTATLTPWSVSREDPRG